MPAGHILMRGLLAVASFGLLLGTAFGAKDAKKQTDFCEICKHAVYFIEANHVPIYNSHGADYFMVGAKSMCKALGEETDTEFVECLGLTKGLRSNPALVNGIAIGCTNKEGTSFGPFECPPSHLCNHLSYKEAASDSKVFCPNAEGEWTKGTSGGAILTALPDNARRLI